MTQQERKSRIAVDVPLSQLDELDVIAKTRNISRNALVLEAITALLIGYKTPQETVAETEEA